METKIKIFLSHQNQCDSAEIDKLIALLQQKGFEIIGGQNSKGNFGDILDSLDCYVCILDQHTHKSNQLAEEITAAAMAGKRIFGIYCPNLGTGISIPSALDDFASGIINWDPEKLIQGLEGKDIGFSDETGKPAKAKRSTIPPPCGK